MTNPGEMMRFPARPSAFASFALLLSLHAPAGAQEHRNAIGWNDGVSFRRYLSPSWGIGARAGLDFQMQDEATDGDERNSMDYSPDFPPEDRRDSLDTEGANDQGLRSFHASIEGFREIRLSKWIRVSPFARTEYRFSWTDSRYFDGSEGERRAPDSEGEIPNLTIGTRSEQTSESTRHATTALVGLRPGVVLLDRIFIEKEFGISLGYENTQGKSTRTTYQMNQGAYRGEKHDSQDGSSWKVRTFGWSDALFSSIQVHVLF